VFPWAKKTRQDIGAVAAFGKVPALGDFVRAPPRSDEMTSFEEWITSAMEYAEARHGAAWKDAFARAEPVAFVWGGALERKGAAKTHGLLAGVIRPSHDAVRRAFPIVVCAPLPIAPFAAAPNLVPLVLGDFFRMAARAASTAADARTQAEFQAAVGGAVAPGALDVAAAKESYAAWSKATRARDVMPGDSAFANAVRTIASATLPFKGKEAPQGQLGVRAPVGAPVESSMAMWIDLVRSASGWSGTVPTFFWPLGGASVLVQLGIEAPASALLDLWLPSKDSEHVCDLGAPTDGASALPEAVSNALANEATTLEALLAAVLAG
jgi:type VI secretion system ImpM family protein